MKTRPFLSHKRQDRGQVIALKRELCLYGAGGWRDLDDLPIGELGRPEFRRVITEVTGGFIWYGTSRAASSNYINTVELPAAIARKRLEPHYPLVPLFLTIRPGEADSKMRPVLGDADADVFFEASGRVRGRERNAEFQRDIAKRYVRAAVASLDQTAFTVGAQAFSEPDGEQDFTLDWRTAFDANTRVLREDPAVLQDALWNLRDGFKTQAPFPELTLDLDLPMPLAVLLGYEWRVTSRMRLTIRQRTRSGVVLVAGDAPDVTGAGAWPEWEVRDLEGSGPAVVAVASTHEPLTQPLETYAAALGSARTFSLHVPRELDAADIRGLARHTATKLREAGRQWSAHFLLAGPTSLAALTGAGSNANGPVLMPFWNGTEYVSPLVIG